MLECIALIKQGDIEGVRKMLDNGLSTNRSACGPRGKGFISLLHTAVNYGQTNIVQLLLERGADVNQLSDSDDYTPLMVAIRKQNLDMVRLLIQHGANVNHSVEDDGWGATYGLTPLMLSAEYDNSDILQVLIDNGAIVDHREEYMETYNTGYTALLYAISYNKRANVKLLLQKGANPNICDVNNVSPLTLALRSRYYRIAFMLIMYGGAECLREFM